jgi:hypothetical protein
VLLLEHRQDIDGAEREYREAIKCDSQHAKAHPLLDIILASKRCNSCNMPGFPDGGQPAKAKGGAPAIKNGGKKGRSKICAKDGCGVIIDESKKCSQCHLVYYCSRDCQRGDRKAHKLTCNAAVGDKAAQDARTKKQSNPRAAAKGTGAGAGAKTGESADTIAEEEECSICLDLLVDPLPPCPDWLAHRCCRVCVEKMREHKLPACPLCRAPMQDSEEFQLFCQSVQLRKEAERAVGEAKASLWRQCIHMLHRVLEVDPHHYEALFNLSAMYTRGEGVEKDAVQAVHWCRKAAEQGFAQAQYNLGCMYDERGDEYGEGVEKDAVQAAHWWQKAAVQEYAAAQYNLGLMYRVGKGVKKDAVQAAHWWQKAAVQGHAAAQRDLGIMYEYGESVEKDAVMQAVGWWQKAQCICSSTV